jgi:dCTP deaminase
LAIVPALFDRAERDVELGYGPDDREKGMATRAGVEWDDAVKDTIAAREAVADADAGKVGIVGYKAKQHAGVINISNIGHYEVLDFWDPIFPRPDLSLVLDPDEFYILASKEAVSVPPDQAAEMRAYDTLVGEFRVHYAGCFDPGFGHDAAGGSGSRGSLKCAPMTCHLGSKMARWSAVWSMSR